MFKVLARSVLELGSELISSDVIAFYELIKNTFDAGTKTGADIRFHIVLGLRSYRQLHRQLCEDEPPLSAARDQVIEKLLSDAGPIYDRALNYLDDANSLEDILLALNNIYALNRITISDTGTGMSKKDLEAIFLVIGTSSRKKEVETALALKKANAPYLGEKGIGRLSAMRLGNSLSVTTARAQDLRWNRLKIDWTMFDDLDAMLEDIEIKASTGKKKDEPTESGTQLRIRDLTSDWTKRRLQELARNEFSLMFAPPSRGHSRRRVALYWNAQRIAIPKLDDTFLAHAHTKVRGIYSIDAQGPRLTTHIEVNNLGFEHPPEQDTFILDNDDLQSTFIGKDTGLDSTDLASVGPFSFDAYWFNRQRLKAIDGIGDRQTVRQLHAQWTGIRLYRDGLRVYPYGGEEDDWLGLDRHAMRARGYTLNKLQFIGHVDIARMANPSLIDQTNREGLRETPEQQVLLDVLRFVIQDQLRAEMLRVERLYKRKRVRLPTTREQVRQLQRRARDAIAALRRISPAFSDEDIVTDLQQLLREFSDFAARAHERIREVESDAQRMIDLAGVGLLVEVIAHELARTSENALHNLNLLQRRAPTDIGAQFEALRASMNSISKRLRVLDPLSVSGRQRREKFDLGALIQDTVEAHDAQFKRHRIKIEVKRSGGTVYISAVKGMVVQVLENLIANSVYWLDLELKRRSRFEPAIVINLDPSSLISFEDNGPGISPRYADKVFELFFSLKEKSKRRGMGLYIARECAEFNGGSLTLDPEPNANGKLCKFLYAVTAEGTI